MMRRGTTLLELIIAMGIIITGLLTVLGLIVRSINIGTLTKNEFVAATLAQEGIEGARNIRDSNSLEIEAGKRDFSEWDYNLYECISPEVDGTCLDSTNRDFNGVLEVSYDWGSCANSSCITKTVWVMDYNIDDIISAAVYKHNDISNTPNLISQRAAGISGINYMEETQYKRFITIEPLCENAGDSSPLRDVVVVGDFADAPTCPTQKLGVRIIVDVEWIEQGKTRSVSLSQDLYDWR